jgi:hypothetical protein
MADAYSTFVHLANMSAPPPESLLAFAQRANAAHQAGGRGASFGLIPGAGVFDPTLWDYVPQEHVEHLDGRVEHLHTDIMDKRMGEPPDPQIDPGGYAAYLQRAEWFSGFKWEWTSFYTRWNQWVASHTNVVWRWGEKAVAEFDEFTRRYNELRRQYIEHFGKAATSASSAHTAIERKDKSGTDITGAVKYASLAVIAIAAAYGLSKLA